MSLSLRRNLMPTDRAVEQWSAMEILDLLDRGMLVDWYPLVQALRTDPRGELALRVERALRGTYLYGTGRLFLTALAYWRGERVDPTLFPKPPELIP